MPPAYDFKLALTRVIEPTGRPWCCTLLLTSWLQ